MGFIFRTVVLPVLVVAVGAGLLAMTRGDAMREATLVCEARVNKATGEEVLRQRKAVAETLAEFHREAVEAERRIAEMRGTTYDLLAEIEKMGEYCRVPPDLFDRLSDIR